MRHAMRLLGPSIVLSMAAALTGCASMAFQSDLVPGSTPAPSVRTARFYIAEVQVSTTVKSGDPQMGTKPLRPGRREPHRPADPLGTKLFGTPGDLSGDALSARPDLFSDDLSAVPLVLKLDCEYRSSMKLMAFLSVLTLGIIPVPGSETADYTVSITFPTMEGDICLGPVAFKRRDVMWVTLLTPLGLIPVPGTSLIPRESQTIVNISDRYVARAQKLTNAVCIEAVVKALGQCDAAKLQALYDSRKSRIHSLSLDGKPAWGFVTFGYSKPGASSGPRDIVVLSIYTKAPTYKAVPADTATVARLGEDGRWRPCTGYLRKSQTLTAASVLLENGLPGRVVLRPVEEPELDDFIDLPAVAEKERAKTLRWSNKAAAALEQALQEEKDLAESIRWSNGVLLQVKNRSLARLVRERSRTELLDLATRMEKAVLTLDAQATQCKDRAQQMVEEGRGDPAPAREMAILYGQRRDILIAILATIKQAAAQKKP